MALFLGASRLHPFPPRRLQIIRPFSHPNNVLLSNIVHPPAVCSIGVKASARREESHGRIDRNVVVNEPFSIGQTRAWLIPIIFGSVVVLRRIALASGGVTEAGMGALEGLRKTIMTPKFLQVLGVLRQQGLTLALMLALSAFFSMAETSITTLWPWKVRELAEKKHGNDTFRMLRRDVSKFLTTILIGTTVVNILATSLVTDAATAIFGGAGMFASTLILTVASLLLTEIIPKSVAVHNATEVARIVVKPIGWISWFLSPVVRLVNFLSDGILNTLGLKARREARSEPYVSVDELKLIFQGAQESGVIEKEEQDIINNILYIKDIDARNAMIALIDVVAISATANLREFRSLYAVHPYSRIPVFDGEKNNIIGIAYTLDLINTIYLNDEELERSSIKEMVHNTLYCVPASTSLLNLLREFQLRKIHMAVVLDEHGGAVGDAFLCWFTSVWRVHTPTHTREATISFSGYSNIGHYFGRCSRENFLEKDLIEEKVVDCLAEGHLIARVELMKQRPLFFLSSAPSNMHLRDLYAM